MSIQLGFKAKEIVAEGRITNEDIKQIKIWLEEQNGLPVISDEEIVNFLLSNDNHQDNTKNTINAFFNIRKEAPDIFNNRLATIKTYELKQFVTYFGIAPRRTKDNCAVMFTKVYDTNFRNFNLDEFIKLLFMTLDAAIYTSPPSGLIIVIDADGGGLGHLTKLRIHAVSIFFRYLQEALPVKLKNIHLLNTSYFVDKTMVIAKPFMSNHVKQLMILHKRDANMDEFFEKYVSKELLPQDFGGELPSMKDLAEELIQTLKTMESYFAAEEDRRYVLQS